jgi:hypothetical protein
LSGGHVADIKGAASLLSATAPSGRMIGDKGYDATHLRLFLESRGTRQEDSWLRDLDSNHD